MITISKVRLAGYLVLFMCLTVCVKGDGQLPYFKALTGLGGGGGAGNVGSNNILKFVGAKAATLSARAYGAIDSDKSPLMNALAQQALQSNFARTAVAKVAAFTLGQMEAAAEANPPHIRQVVFRRQNPVDSRKTT